MADADAFGEVAAPNRLPASSSGAPAPTGSAPEADRTMSLVDHLVELRSRLIRSILAIIVGAAVGFVVSSKVRQYLIELLPAGQVQALGVGDAFAISLKISIVIGIILAMPVLLYQLWAFVAPGLTPHERRLIRPWIPLALFFFALGVLIAYVILPFALGFLLGFTDKYIVGDRLAAGPYFDFVTTMFLAFGLLMEFPIVLYALSRVGIVTSARMRSSRRIAILGIAIFATVATPGGDLVSPTVLGGTMYLLYELTLIAIRRSGK
jgi:sec-independent protein translocase protein TatC